QLREVEEIDEIRDQLLRHERLASDLVAIALLGSCTILWVLARSARSFGRDLRSLWWLMLAALLSGAYYLNSRVEVQQYEHSMHLSMFVLEMVLAMTGVRTLVTLYPRFWGSLAEFRAGGIRALPSLAALLLLVSIPFTFYHFD